MSNIYDRYNLGGVSKLPESLVGGAGGAASGALAGSAVGPVGTIVGAGIGALTSLLSGLFGAGAKREEERRKMLLQGAQDKATTERQGVSNFVGGSQGAFAQMLDGYRSALR